MNSANKTTQLPTSAEMFLATLGDQTLEEALANAELDAASFAWPRAVVREVGHRVRLAFVARKGQPVGEAMRAALGGRS